MSVLQIGHLVYKQVYDPKGLNLLIFHLTLLINSLNLTILLYAR